MNQEMHTIKQRFVDLLISGYYATQTAPLQESSMVEDEATGTLYWTDIDYSEKPAAEYSAQEHLNRIIRAIYYEGSQRLARDCAWRDKLIKLLRYWLAHDFCSTGWWHNQIGNPLLLVDLMLLMEAYIPEDQRDILLDRISRGTLDEPPAKRRTYFTRQRPHEWTGANLMWGAAITMKYAALTENEKLLRKAVDWICTALQYKAQGVQPDGGFQQHGPRWYSNGYGISFTSELTPLIYCVQDTPYAFESKHLEVLLCHVLEGQWRMQHRGYFDYGSVGRQFSRPGNLQNKRMAKAVELLSQMPSIPRRDALQQYLSELRDGKTSTKGTKYYESVCVLQHSDQRGYISIRGSRPDTYGAEQTNKEGWLCYNMSYGTNTCLMRSGREYYDMSPVWDYAKIPGTTARQENEVQLKKHGDWDVLFREENTCQGFVQDDRGVMIQYVSHDGISLKAAYFVFNGCLVALGANLTDKEPDTGAVITTVEQSRADNAAVLSEQESLNSGWRYRNLDPTTKFQCSIGPVTGSWKRNNPAQSDDPVTEQVFLLTIPIEHGIHSYAYSVTPEDSTIHIEVLRNDGACHAILVNYTHLMAYCYEETEIEVPGNKLTLSAGVVISDLKKVTR